MKRTLETSQLLALVGVTETQLRNDMRDHFLVPPDVAHPADGRPQVALWRPLGVRRAKRLYRLRRRGAQGMRLRILLFLADGWAWEHIRATCLKGLERGLNFSLLGVKRYGRSGNLEFANRRRHRPSARRARPHGRGSRGLAAHVAADDALLRRGAARGRPAPRGSGKRLMQPLARLLRPDIGERGAAMWMWLFDLLVGMLNLRAERLVRLATEAEPKDVERGRLLFNQNVWFLRQALRRNAGEAWRGHSFNPLTICGHAGATMPAEFAKNPAGITAAQTLGGTFALSLALDVAFARFADYWMRMLPWIVRRR
jgi:hypothetical protein